MQVLDALGRVVRSQPLVFSAGAEALLDLRALAAGFYALRVCTRQGQFISRLVVQ